MVQAWWAAGVAVPAVIVKSALNGRAKAKLKEEDISELRQYSLNYSCFHYCSYNNNRGTLNVIVARKESLSNSIHVLNPNATSSAGLRTVVTPASSAREFAPQTDFLGAWAAWAR